MLEPTLALPWHPWVLQEGLEAEPLWWERRPLHQDSQWPANSTPHSSPLHSFAGFLAGSPSKEKQKQSSWRRKVLLILGGILCIILLCLSEA